MPKNPTDRDVPNDNENMDDYKFLKNLEEFAEANEIPHAYRTYFVQMSLAIKSQNFRVVRNLAAKLERHATGKSVREALPAEQTIQLLAEVDFAGADPSDDKRLKEAYRFVKAAQQVGAANPNAIDSELCQQITAANRLIAAKRVLLKAGR